MPKAPTRSFIGRLLTIFRYNEPKSFVELPLPSKGKLFVSPMPFGPYDVHNRMFKMYLKFNVSMILVLVTDKEIEKKAKKNPLPVYEKHQMQVIRVPFADLTAPIFEDLAAAIPPLLVHLKKKNVAIHCNAGVGRTGVIAACVAAAMMKMTGDEALEYIQKHMTIQITDEQSRLVNRWVREEFPRYGFFS